MNTSRSRLVSAAVGAAIVVAAPVVSVAAASAAPLPAPTVSGSTASGSTVSSSSVTAAPLTVADQGTFAAGKPVVIRGTALPGSTVLVSLPGVAERGFVDVRADGSWQYQVRAALWSGSFAENKAIAQLPGGARAEVVFAFDVR